MSSFNLNQIITQYNLDEESLAKELFPNNKFPKVALTRITSGASFLDTWQLDILAKILEVQVSDLFKSENWSIKEDDEKIIFHKNDYRVELNLETLISNIYRAGKLVAEEKLIVDKNIMLSEYLKLVNRTIINLI